MPPVPPESAAASAASPAAKTPPGAADGNKTKGKAATSAPPSASAGSNNAESNIKETIESILVAFILAFVFRAFVVEAFVIPTGSMAPTLMGAHMRFSCPDCGYQFDVNFSNGARGGDDTLIPDYAQTAPTDNDPDRPIVYDRPPVNRNPRDPSVYAPPIYCPNCGQQIPRSSARNPDDDASSPPVYYGDRILVLKYRYLFQHPSRWDVVVFKAPVADIASGPNGEKGFHYTENYIKRLVGLPGETIVILDGDVYAKAPGANTFAIQRKPYSVQKDLWRVVYDNDYIPHTFTHPAPAPPWSQPWTIEGGKGWNLASTPGADPSKSPSRVFRFQSADGGGSLAFDPAANPDTHALTDWLAYDQASGDRRSNAGEFYYPVSDLDLSCDYQRKSGDGPFSLQLTKGLDVFTARIEPRAGKAPALPRHRQRPRRRGRPLRRARARPGRLPPRAPGVRQLRLPRLAPRGRQRGLRHHRPAVLPRVARDPPGPAVAGPAETTPLAATPAQHRRGKKSSSATPSGSSWPAATTSPSPIPCDSWPRSRTPRSSTCAWRATSTTSTTAKPTPDPAAATCPTGAAPPTPSRSPAGRSAGPKANPTSTSSSATTPASAATHACGATR